LCLGVIRDESRDRFSRIVADLARSGAAGIIFGCTEIGLLLSDADSSVPVFDTSTIHAAAAVEFALR
jgi:aspartate racemase